MGATFKQVQVNAFPATNILMPGVVAGNLLIGAFYYADGRTITSLTDDSGDGVPWTILNTQFDSGDGLRGSLAYKYAGKSQAYTITLTLSGATGFCQILCAEYSGLTGGPQSSNGNFTGGAGSGTIDCGGLNPVGAQALVILFGEISSVATTFTPSAGLTKRFDNNSNALADGLTAASGAQNPTFTLSVAQHWIGLGAAFSQLIPPQLKQLSSSPIRFSDYKILPIEKEN